jgi:phosphate transport system substrate-binding protein
MNSNLELQGSGATFPAPLCKRWFIEYYTEHPDVRVNHSPIGSDAGMTKKEEQRTQSYRRGEFS